MARRVVALFGSINTAYAAQISLQSLAATRTSLQSTQTRIATGLKIATAKDNGAVWAVAQLQTVQSRALDPVKDSLNNAKSVLDVTLSAGAQMTDLLRQMKQKALAASDPTVSDDVRTQYQAEFDKLTQTYSNVVSSATFNDVNLIDENDTALSGLGSANGQVRVGSAHVHLDIGTLFSQDFQVLYDSSADVLQAQDPTALQAQWIQMPIIRPHPPVPVPITTWADGSGSQAASTMGLVDAALDAVTSALAGFGADSKAMDNQLSLVSNLQDSLNAGVGNLVDADVAKSGAQLKALQTREQLGLQALSIANSSSKMLLTLFRKPGIDSG